MIVITPLNAAGLLAYLKSADFASSPAIAITPLRALAQAHNPRLRADDVVLLLARAADGQLLGYFGILPDTVFLASGEARHCGWLSGLWVSPAHRGQGIARQLLDRAFAAWNGQLLITEFVPATERLCRRSGYFRDLPTRPGIRLYLRADTATLLPPKGPWFARARPLLRLLDHATNAVLSLRYAGRAALPVVEYVPELDAEARHFIDQQHGRQLTRHGAPELNWLLHYPWLRSAPHPDADGRRYEFSSEAQPFGFTALKVRDPAGGLAAVLVLARRGNALKLPYCYHTGNVGLVSEVLFAHLRQWRIATFTTFQPDLVEYLRGHATPALLRRSLSRGYMASTAIEGLPSAFEIQDGDADCGFT